MFFLSFGPATRAGLVSTKNPRLTGNRGFLEIYFLIGLEGSSRDADAAVPNGHLVLGSLAAQTDISRGRHFLTAVLNTKERDLSRDSTSIHDPGHESGNIRRRQRTRRGDRSA